MSAIPQVDNSTAKHNELNSTPVVSYLAENILNTPLNKIGVNPFVNQWTEFERIDYIKVIRNKYLNLFDIT